MKEKSAKERNEVNIFFMFVEYSLSFPDKIVKLISVKEGWIMDWFTRLFMYIVLGAVLTITYNLIRGSIRVSKNRKIIACMDALDNETDFFNKIDEYIESEKSREFKMKGRILKIYACIQNNRLEEAGKILNDLDFLPLIYRDRFQMKINVSANEDSFFYYCFLSCIHLYSLGQLEMISLFKSILDDYKVHLKYQLFYELFDATVDYYKKQYDCGQEVFENIYIGKFKRKKYAKPMRGLYLNLAECFLARIALDENRTADFEEKYKTNLIKFNQSSMGEMVLKNLGIAPYLKENK